MHRKLFLLLISLFVALLINGCPDNADKHTDPTANESPEDSTADTSIYAFIKGDWKGEYRLTKNYGMANEVTYHQAIIATVDSASYKFTIDTTIAGLTYCFCKTAGILTITSLPTIRLQSLMNVPSGGSCVACNGAESPNGYFQAQLVGDTLKLAQFVSPTMMQLSFWRP